MAIESRNELAEYCLRKLGKPVIQINVSEEQISDRLDDALEKFAEYHADGTQIIYRHHVLTESDINNQYIRLPESISSVLRIVPAGGLLTNTDSLSAMAYTEQVGFMLRTSSGSLSSFTISQQYSQLVSDYFNYEKGLRFNRYMSRVFIDTLWTNYAEGDGLLLECYEYVNPERWRRVYGDQWLRKYATALLKKQWGNNLSKFAGVQLPSGMTLDGPRLIQEADAEIEKLEEELRTEWSLPLDVFVG